MITATFVYDDPGHPDRSTGTISSPAWTPEDRALVMALADFEASLCRCGQPRHEAWHSEMDGFYDAVEWVCHGCTARNDGKAVTYSVVRSTRPDEKGPLPPFVLGVTTTSSD